MRDAGGVGGRGAWAPGLALGETGRQALAMFLGCKKALLPAGLMVVPYYGTLISANFKALNLWMPLLRTTVACTKRGEAVCKTLGIKKAAMHFLLSGLVFLSKSCMVCTRVLQGVLRKLTRRWRGGLEHLIRRRRDASTRAGQRHYL